MLQNEQGKVSTMKQTVGFECSLFVYSRYCPICLTPNIDNRDHCSGCHQVLRWDTAQDFKEEWRYLVKESRGLRLGGLVKLIIGVGILVMTVLYLIYISRVSGWFYFIVPVIGFGFIGRSLRDLAKSSNISNFCHDHRDLVP
jgi:hypothetical protein